MALLDGLFGPQQLTAQPPGQGLLGGGWSEFTGNVRQMANENPEALYGLAAGLMKGEPHYGIAAMGDAVGQYREREAKAGLQREGWDRQDARFAQTHALDQARFDNTIAAQGTERAQERQQLNQTLKWAESTGDPDVIGLAGAGMFDEAFKVWNAKNKVGSGSDYGVTPIYGQDENGNTVLLQVGKGGDVIQPAIPDGITPLSPYGVNEQKARGTAVGKGMGEAQQELGGALAEADYSIRLIDDMLEHPGRETATGASSWFDPRNYMAGTDATNFNVRRQQLEGRAFLQAFESLKGGGQITETEGAKAQAAIARLNTAQSDEEYQAALLELRGILEIGKQRAAQRAGAPIGPVEVPFNPGANRTSGGVSWSVE